ncbi:MAG: cobalamin biosynthesis protein CobW, partial [Actinomycetota bacterium]|nr:cobalamin biosynthesis protein CobW [Actinomycetota bacterium]
MSNDRRVRLVLVAGLRRDHTGMLATRLLLSTPGTAVLDHDLRRIGEGRVRRRLRLGSSDSTTTLDLAHGCVSCTVREDLLPLLRTLIADAGVHRIVLHLDPMVEPEPVCWALHNVLVGKRTIADLATIEAVVAVVDERTWLVDASGDKQLVDGDFGVVDDDERTLAQVAVGQVE